jgi:decaprenylphospho-beta-D-ribofuranose 2-oxidase
MSTSPPRPSANVRALSGWGGTAPSVAQVIDTPDEATLRSVLADIGPRGAIARGLGRSYGAPAQNAGGLVVAMADDGPDALGAVRVDRERATVTAPAGVSIDALLRLLVPDGWFVPVTPGTRHVTVGGAVAADIHGKNHHADGSFGHHVRSLRLMLADGSVEEVSPEIRPDLFWATIGGMGLTGVILDVTFSVLPIETSRLLVDTERCTDLDHLCQTMTEGDDDYRYSVAWIDLLATGRHLGRSVLTRAEHATSDQLDATLSPRSRVASRLTAKAKDALAYHPRVLAGVPPFVPEGLLRPATVRAFNEVWYRRAPAQRHTTLESIGAYFHPLDAVAGWNRLYGPSGFLQYQFVVPLEAQDVLRLAIERLARSGAPSFLAVLKRCGPGNPGPLSFPMIGWTLALDIPAAAAVGPMLQELDDAVLEAGGRHYLAKDALLSAADVRRGYPRLDEWRRVRDKVDPSGVWTSDLARRVGLVG